MAAAAVKALGNDAHIASKLRGSGCDRPGWIRTLRKPDAIIVVGYTKRDEGEFIDSAGVSHLFHLFPPMTDPTAGDRIRAAL